MLNISNYFKLTTHFMSSLRFIVQPSKTPLSGICHPIVSSSGGSRLRLYLAKHERSSSRISRKAPQDETCPLLKDTIRLPATRIRTKYVITSHVTHANQQSAIVHHRRRAIYAIYTPSTSGCSMCAL